MNMMLKSADLAGSTPIVEDRRRPISPLDLENDLSEIAQMARIASLTVFEVVGETEFNRSGEDGQVFEVIQHDLTPDGVTRALFAVDHVVDMIRALQKKLDLA
ncbi:DNA recombination-dependent growth factor C [Bradyrhizobium sp. CIR18]|uniref:hypothetical protein n=1 Tax=Bradyrhizobium sp. CIR18 TaxID=2663839 RepID=UPI0016059FA4|nr:hypothetical protein [Bradyrhizobium sp. CIR18]MBB4362160.1 DNA recombination-dependent growth factor C [Bradyrhizobium sp. CIR18]